MNGIKRILNKIHCAIGIHDWTCAADQGIKATRQQLDNGIDGFYDYAKMYCKNCKVESDLNNRYI